MGTDSDYLERHLREVPLFRALLRSVECRLIESLGSLERPVLDLGCGDGIFASMLTEDPVWFGLDPDEAAVRRALVRGSHSSLAVGNGCHLPFPEGSLATVVANSVLEHIPDLEETLSEVFRVLQAEGRLILTVPSDRFAEMLFGSWFLSKVGLARFAKSYGEWFNRHSRHFHTDSLSTWIERLERHGFAVEQSRVYFSDRAHRVFDVLHYLSLPRLMTYYLTGMWVSFPSLWTNRLFHRWLAPYVEMNESDLGAYLFIAARKMRR